MAAVSNLGVPTATPLTAPLLAERELLATGGKDQ
jgi:hypothetical protein